MSERADAPPPRCQCGHAEGAHVIDRVTGGEYCKGRACLCWSYVPAEAPPAGLSRLTRDAVLSARRRMR
jgi:hypothetical protein